MHENILNFFIHIMTSNLILYIENVHPLLRPKNVGGHCAYKLISVNFCVYLIVLLLYTCLKMFLKKTRTVTWRNGISEML